MFYSFNEKVSTKTQQNPKIMSTTISIPSKKELRELVDERIVETTAKMFQQIVQLRKEIYQLKEANEVLNKKIDMIDVR